MDKNSSAKKNAADEYLKLFKTPPPPQPMVITAMPRHHTIISIVLVLASFLGGYWFLEFFANSAENKARQEMTTMEKSLEAANTATRMRTQIDGLYDLVTITENGETFAYVIGRGDNEIIHAWIQNTADQKPMIFRSDDERFVVVAANDWIAAYDRSENQLTRDIKLFIPSSADREKVEINRIFDYTLYLDLKGDEVGTSDAYMIDLETLEVKKNY